MYEHRIAYRHPGTGEVEGFKGVGFTKRGAEHDAVGQVRLKVDMLAATSEYGHVYDKAHLITSPSRLTPDELATTQKDWDSGLRRRPSNFKSSF